MRNRASIAALAASLLAFAAADAQALSLKLTDLSGDADQVIVNDDDGDDAVGFMNPFGGFSFTIAGGTSSNYPPEASLFAQFLARSDGAASASFALSDTGFTLGGTDRLANFLTGLTSNSDPNEGRLVTVSSYADASNNLFGTDTLLGSISGGVDAGTFANLLDFDEPFSLTHVITITHEGGGTSNGDADTDVAPVPLPAAAWMLAGALGGLGALSRKRRKA